MPPQSTALDESSLSTRQILGLAAALMAVAVAPLFLMEYPALDDYFHHLSRVYIISEGTDGPLGRFYIVDWRLLPNLAMDLVVPPLTVLVPIEDAGRLFVGLSLLLMGSGTLALYAALHGGLSWWPLLVFLVLWNRVFLWGLSNYLFTLGLVLWALAGWIHFRGRSAAFRVPLFSVIALVLFIFHLHAFGVYALAIGGYELSRLDWRSRDHRANVRELALSAAQFMIPILLFILLSPTSDYVHAFDYPSDLIKHKFRGFHHLFYNYNLWFDRLVFVVLTLCFLALLVLRRVPIHAQMRVPLAFLLLAYLLLPEALFDTNFVDYRLPLAFIMLLIASTRITALGFPLAKFVALGLLTLFLVRMGLIAERWYSFDGVYQTFLDVIEEKLPEGATMVTIATRMPDYHSEFHRPQLLYMSALAIIKKQAFDPSFEEFAHPGKHLVRLKEEYQALVDELKERLVPVADTRSLTVTPPLEIVLPGDATAEDAGSSSEGGDEAGFAKPILREFEYVLLLFANDTQNPAPEHLEQLYAGERFQLYKVRNAVAASSHAQP
jgi:hypothetical protein